MRSLLKSAGVGLASAVILGVFAFVVGSKTNVVTAYLLPGQVIAGVLSPVVPSALVYWLDPQGGPPAFLLQALAWSVLSWSVLFGLLYHYRHRFRSGTR